MVPLSLQQNPLRKGDCYKEQHESEVCVTGSMLPVMAIQRLKRQYITDYRKWSAQEHSKLQPQSYQDCALSHLSYGPFITNTVLSNKFPVYKSEIWWEALPG